MERILNKIKAYETIIIHGHKRPDGDCYGAQFGLKDILVNSFPNKRIYVVGETSQFVDFVGKMDTIADDVYNGALAIVVDTAVESRISDPRYKLAKEVIKIDHHIPVDNYGDLRWVDTNFPSCAQMIAYFYLRFKDKLSLSKAGAIAMYTGIVTDTGRFRFRGVSQLTHQIAGMLLSKGVDVEYIDQQLSKESLDVLRFKGHIYQNIVTTPGGFIYAIVKQEDFDKFNVTTEEGAAMVSLLGGIEGYPVWALFIEYPNTDEIRVRIRSNGPNIDKVANKYRGGGHAKASGATLYSWDELPFLIKDVEETIKNA